MNKRKDNIVTEKKKSFNALDFFQYLMYNSWCSVCQGQKCHILMNWTVDMLDVCNAGNESSRNCVCIATYLHFYVFVFAFSYICICIFMYLYSLLSVLQRAFSSGRQPISLRGARKNEESKAKNNWSRKKIIGDDFLLLFIIAAYSFWGRPTKPYQSVFILNFFYCAVFTTKLYIFYENGCFGESTLLFRLISKIFQICER